MIKMSRAETLKRLQSIYSTLGEYAVIHQRNLTREYIISTIDSLLHWLIDMQRLRPHTRRTLTDMANLAALELKHGGLSTISQYKHEAKDAFIRYTQMEFAHFVHSIDLQSIQYTLLNTIVNLQTMYVHDNARAIINTLDASLTRIDHLHLNKGNTNGTTSN